MERYALISAIAVQTKLPMAMRTATDHARAMTIPITTLGMALTCNLWRKAIIRAVLTSRVIEKYVINLFPPFVFAGFNMKWDVTKPSSIAIKRAIWASLEDLTKEMETARSKNATRRGTKK